MGQCRPVSRVALKGFTVVNGTIRIKMHHTATGSFFSYRGNSLILYENGNLVPYIWLPFELLRSQLEHVKCIARKWKPQKERLASPHKTHKDFTANPREEDTYSKRKSASHSPSEIQTTKRPTRTQIRLQIQGFGWKPAWEGFSTASWIHY